MEIFLDKRAVRQIRLSAQDAIEEGDTETLREDILEAFTEEQVEEIERRLDTGDFFEFLTDLLDEWSGDDADELLELIDTQLGDVGVDLKFEKRGAAPVEGEEDEPPGRVRGRRVRRGRRRRRRGRGRRGRGRGRREGQGLTSSLLHRSRGRSSSGSLLSMYSWHSFGAPLARGRARPGHFSTAQGT